MLKKDFFITATKKGKTRGRPSKAELWLSKYISDIGSTNAFQKLTAKKIYELTVYGQTSTTDAEYEAMINEAVEEMKKHGPVQRR